MARVVGESAHLADRFVQDLVRHLRPVGDAPEPRVALHEPYPHVAHCAAAQQVRGQDRAGETAADYGHLEGGRTFWHGLCVRQSQITVHRQTSFWWRSDECQTPEDFLRLWSRPPGGPAGPPR